MGVRLSLPVVVSPSGVTELGAWQVLVVMLARTLIIHGGLVQRGTVAAWSHAGEVGPFVVKELQVTDAVDLPRVSLVQVGVCTCN